MLYIYDPDISYSLQIIDSIYMPSFIFLFIHLCIYGPDVCMYVCVFSVWYIVAVGDRRRYLPYQCYVINWVMCNVRIIENGGHNVHSIQKYGWYTSCQNVLHMSPLHINT